MTILSRCLAGVVLCVALAPSVAPAEPPAAAPPQPRTDRGKGVIEGPTKAVVAAAANLADTGTPFVNPKVEPGKVNWHPDFATACQAAHLSGKPVLLFQMMGRLDDKFC
jgi:hypothetical protein